MNTNTPICTITSRRGIDFQLRRESVRRAGPVFDPAGEVVQADLGLHVRERWTYTENHQKYAPR
jgi:hypothetical protein